MKVFKTFDSDECSLIDIKKDKFHSNLGSLTITFDKCSTLHFHGT